MLGGFDNEDDDWDGSEFEDEHDDDESEDDENEDEDNSSLPGLEVYDLDTHSWRTAG